MPRTRQLKHDFFMNEELARLSPYARLLFSGLWVLADREGRMEDRPAKIKAQIFPYESVDIESLLVELSNGFVTRYEVLGSKFLSVDNFKKHQHIHPDEKKSQISPPPKNSTKNIDRHEPSSGLSTEEKKSPGISGDLKRSPEIRPSSSSFSSFNPLPPSKGEGGLFQSVQSVKLVPSVELIKSFELFWEVWPKRRDKQSALKAWKKLKPDSELVGKIIQALSLQKRTEEWTKEDGQFIPRAVKWITNRLWEDDIPGLPAQKSNVPRCERPGCRLDFNHPVGVSRKDAEIKFCQRCLDDEQVEIEEAEEKTGLPT